MYPASACLQTRGPSHTGNNRRLCSWIQTGIQQSKLLSRLKAARTLNTETACSWMAQLLSNTAEINELKEDLVKVDFLLACSHLASLPQYWCDLGSGMQSVNLPAPHWRGSSVTLDMGDGGKEKKVQGRRRKRKGGGEKKMSGQKALQAAMTCHAMVTPLKTQVMILENTNQVRACSFCTEEHRSSERKSYILPDAKSLWLLSPESCCSFNSKAC